MIKLGKKFSEKHGVKINFMAGNILSIPFEENKFDYVVSAAVLHHLDSGKKRMKALEEMKRVLKNKGKLFLTVWNKPKKEDSLHADNNFKISKDSYIHWTRKGVKYQRYYHFFLEEELKELLQKVGFKRIKVFLDEGKKNICVLAVNS